MKAYAYHEQTSDGAGWEFWQRLSIGEKSSYSGPEFERCCSVGVARLARAAETPPHFLS